MATTVVAALVVALVVAVTPAGGQGAGGSIVHIRDGNVWLMAPDGSGARQVTTDGTAEDPYRAPTQSDDGTIWAVRREAYLDGEGRSHGRGWVHRMDRHGTSLGAPFAPPQAEAGDSFVQYAWGITDLAVSPDGQVLVYETFYSSTNCATPGCIIGDPAWFLLAVRADGSSPVTSPLWVLHDEPEWISSTTVLTTSRFDGAFTASLDATEATPWWDDELNRVSAAAYAAGSFAAVVDRWSDEASAYVSELHVFATPGPPTPPQTGCVAATTADGYYSDTDVAGDGRTLVWEETPYDDQGQGGIWSAAIEGSSPCAVSTARLIAADATAPEWGPAPPSGDGPPPPPGGGGELPEGVTRMDAGGAVDPVGQAVGLSRALFDAGGADRVVLATADRFPDALAGAALAGVDGPILFTPSDQPLDPRVATEIARVTGGDGVVLTLGGTVAVTEEAAAAARAAAGDRPCASPLPSSCRFAGSGREETAALIADAVAAEHPAAAGMAMVARGDDFADAITGGAFAAATGIPILLTPTDLAHPFTRAWLDRHPTEFLIVLGGTAAVADQTLAQLPALQRVRVAGAERTATSVAIATDLWQVAGGGRGGVALVNVRSPEGWQTALSAAVASAMTDMPQIGVESPPAGLSPTVRDHLSGSAAGLPIVAFGDPSLVSDAQLVEAAQARG